VFAIAAIMFLKV